MIVSFLAWVVTLYEQFRQRRYLFPKTRFRFPSEIAVYGSFFFGRKDVIILVSPILPGGLCFIIKICGCAKSVVYRQFD